jgi:hypothetical protein
LVRGNANYDPFWANYGGDIWVECKNVEAKVAVERVDTFVGKISGKSMEAGPFFSVAGFTKEAMDRAQECGN